MLEAASALFDFGKTLIDKLFPDPAEKAKAEATLLEMQQSGEIQRAQIRMSAILAEAQSQDKWTSRARPSFLYVIYVMILASIPMGALYAFNPVLANAIAVGMKQWLDAIPQPLWMLFGTGYLGYSASRSFDKAKIIRASK